MTETVKNTLAVNQVWKNHSDKDYGDILDWKVTQVGKTVAIVQNMATMKEMIIDNKNISSFTWRCALQDYKPRH